MFGIKKNRRKKKPHRPKPGTHPATGAAAIEQFIVEEIELGGAPETPATAPARKRPTTKWLTGAKQAAGAFGLWLLLFLASLFARSPWPLEETRVLGAAWEMWTADSFLVPRLNGEFYPQVPMLYWLIHLGWSTLGVNEWWGRLVPAVFLLASLFMTTRIARRLWPLQNDVIRHAPFVLLGTIFFALSATMVMPDLLMLFFTLFAMWTLLILLHSPRRNAWFLLGTALGLGLLAGGPLVLLYVLPAALLAPIWAGRESWKYWYRDVFKAVLLASGIFALWLVPAAIRSGMPFAVEVVMKPLTGMRSSFFPGIPYWWGYMFLLPFVFLPWSIWPLPWIRLWHIRRQAIDAGLGFCLAWLVPAVLILSLLEDKSAQLLLPVLPAGALVVAYLLFAETLRDYAQEQTLAGMAVPIILLGCLLAVLPKLPQVTFLPSLLWELSPFVGVGVVGVGIALAWLPWRRVEQRVRDIVIVGVMLVVFVLLGAASQFDPLYRVEAVARYLSTAQNQNRPIAHVGGYQGQFHFAGRLQQSLEVIQPAEIKRWLAWHPQGLLVTYTNAWQPRVSPDAKPAFDAPYHDHRIRIWPASAVLSGSP